MKWQNTCLAVAVACGLVACGGDDYTPGALVATPTTTATLSPAQFQAASPTLFQVAGAPTCTVSFHHFPFTTLGGAGEEIQSTAAIIAPSGSAPACTGARPVLLYAHGTKTDKAFNMANASDDEAALVAAMYAAQGYIVVAPNYAGYDQSTLSYHPYLNMEQQAGEMVHAWQAARQALPGLGLQAGNTLFVAGYSQGGFVSMATQRALQQAGTPVTAGAHLSGVYALGRFGDAVYAGNVNAGATLFSPLLTTSFQKAYGNIYTTPADMYESPYASGIETLLPSTTPRETLIAEGKLPQLRMFSGAPTPAGFEVFFGAGHLIKDSYRAAVLADAQANPTAPQHPLRVAGYRNDLLAQNWTPAQPMLLCGGNADPTVFFNLNTLGAKTYFTGKGVPDTAVTVLDVDSPATGNDPFATVKGGFAQAKAATAPADVLAKYHGTLVPPFCNAAARGYFSQFLSPL